MIWVEEDRSTIHVRMAELECVVVGRSAKKKLPALQGKSHLCIPFLGIARSQSYRHMSVGTGRQ
jgi:hypothetical protein